MYWILIERFRLQTSDNNDSLTYKKYNPDNPDIETACFKDDKLISIST